MNKKSHKEDVLVPLKKGIMNDEIAKIIENVAKETIHSMQK